MNVKLQEISKGYPQGDKFIQVLHKLQLEVGEGEKVAVIGPSGSGKSTLLSLLAGLDRPDQGDIYVSGQHLNTMSEEDLAGYRGQKLGIVFQQFHLLPHLTALENVSVPLEISGTPLKEAQTRAKEALGRLGLAERASHFPHQLSGGECQRVAIARALIAEPRLLLADEPSGNLDEETGKRVLNNLFEQIEGRQVTTILVTHSLQLARRCDRIVQLREGQLHSYVGAM